MHLTAKYIVYFLWTSNWNWEKWTHDRQRTNTYTHSLLQPIVLRASGTQKTHTHTVNPLWPTLPSRREDLLSFQWHLPFSSLTSPQIVSPPSLWNIQRRELSVSPKKLCALWGIFTKDAGNATAVTLTMINGGETGFFCFCYAADCPPERSGGNVFNGSICIALWKKGKMCAVAKIGCCSLPLVCLHVLIFPLSSSAPHLS